MNGWEGDCGGPCTRTHSERASGRERERERERVWTRVIVHKKENFVQMLNVLVYIYVYIS